MKFSPEKKGKVSMGDFDSKVRHIELFTYKDSSTLWQDDKSYSRNDRNYTSHVQLLFIKLWYSRFAEIKLFIFFLAGRCPLSKLF